MTGQTGQTLAVVPAGLWLASQRIAEQAAVLAISSGHPCGSTERAGMAAAGLHRALDDYRAAFARRLETISDELAHLAVGYAVTDDDSGAVLDGAGPAEQR